MPRPDDGRFFAERMTVRLSMQAAIHDPTNPFRPARKAAHRGHADVRVRDGNHDVEGAPLATLHGWYPFEVFHLPLRSTAGLPISSLSGRMTCCSAGVVALQRSGCTDNLIYFGPLTIRSG